ncbi:MAG: hypothetical protein CMO12_00285 [Thaumarchaeota archaeon]|jgi:hypothetical protein|nr:hypothetical protein [Nitrososphaerota archaeon]|tara:strand:+ start:10422 stop:10937 length:516 start_codon:yes stop_codon:yes gene_type:complete
MNRLIVVGAIFIVLTASGGILAYLAYVDTIYALERANALFSRAETAGFAEGVVLYMDSGRKFLPTEGNPVWIFPTDKTNFRLINNDLNELLERGRMLQKLPRNSDGYQQGMDDLRGRIKTIQIQVSEAAPFLYASLPHILTSLAWTILLLGFISYLSRRKGESAPLDYSGT